MICIGSLFHNLDKDMYKDEAIRIWIPCVLVDILLCHGLWVQHWEVHWYSYKEIYIDCSLSRWLYALCLAFLKIMCCFCEANISQFGLWIMCCLVCV